MQVAVRGRNHRPCRQWRVTISRPTPRSRFLSSEVGHSGSPLNRTGVDLAPGSASRMPCGSSQIASAQILISSQRASICLRRFCNGVRTQPGSSSPPADRAPTGSCHSYEDHPPRRIGAVPRSIDRRAADRGRPGVRSTPRNSGDPGATWVGERSTFHDRAFGQLRYGGPPRRS
jgi:hypothetical protein